MHCLLVLPMCVGGLCLFLARTLFGIAALFIGAPNVCRGFVSVSCKDSLWYSCIVYWCSQCLKGFCFCFFQGLSIGIDALFIGAPNVCRGFVSVPFKDSLLV